MLTRSDDAGAISHTYDAAGDRTSDTDRNGGRTDLTYDGRGNLLTKTDPAPSPGAPRPLTTFTYDSKNNLTQITDPLLFTTTLTYEPASNVLLSVSRQIDATASAVTTYEYGDAANPGLPTRIVAPRGNLGPTPDYAVAATLAYDAQGQLVARADPDGNAAGGVPADHTWSIAYDEDDRETSRTDPLGHALAFGYDGAGDRTSLTDRNGNVTAYAYDGSARLASVQQRPDPAGPAVYTTQIERDENGSATRITQGNGVHTDYSYDGIDRLISVTTYPNASTILTTNYVLDGNGQPTRRTTADGLSVTYTYDGLSRLANVSGPSLSIAYAYDAAGHRTSMTDATGTTGYQYDGLGRVTQIASPNGTLAYGYDRDGDRTSLGYPGGDAVSHDYSPGGRLSSLTDWAGRIARYTYQPSGLVAAATYPNGMTATYSYDRAQRITNVANAIGPVAISQHSYGLDAEGNRTALDEFVSGIDVAPLAWSPSVQVNDVSTSQQDRPAIAIGSDGASYLIWDDYRSGSNGDIYFSRRDTSTGAWSANEKVNDDATGETQWQPALALDQAANVYAVWQDNRDSGAHSSDTNIYFSRRDASTGTWSPNIRVNDDIHGSEAQIEPRIAATWDGSAVSAWTDHRSKQWNIYSARLPSGGAAWSANARVTDNASSRKYTPQVALGPDGTAYAVWEDDRSGNSDIWFATLPPGANAWSANTKISDDPGLADQYDPHIGVDAAGDIVVAYLDDRDPVTKVRMTRRLVGSQAWEPSIVANDAAAIPAVLDVAVRASGDAYAVWQDARGTSWDIWGADYTFATNTWASSTMVSDDPGSTAQLRPTVALDPTQVAAAWRDDRVSYGDIRARVRTGSGVSQPVHYAYTYDGLSRLTAVAGPLAETFTLDAATNLAARTGPDAVYTVDGANRVTSDGLRTFVWDDADRLVQRGADMFAYDPLARMITSTVAGTARSYAYNGDGLLASRTEGAPTTPYLWDASTAPAPLVASGSDRVVYGLGPLYIAHADGTTTTLARDGLGSVRAEVSDLGLVTRSFRYAAYGQIAQASVLGATPSLLGFAGELADPSGLIYLRARWYDPGTGRFMTADAFGGAAAVPSSLNSYGYAAGSPTVHVDPTGNCLCFVPIAGAVIGGGIAGAVYLATHEGDTTAGGFAGAVATGAITGAVASIAPLAGGSIAAGAFGASSTGLLATGIAAGLNFAAGSAGAAVGWATANAIDSAFGGAADWTPTPGNWLITGAASAIGGSLGSRLSPMVGVYTLRQLRFAPQSIASSGPNMSRFLGSAIGGSFIASFGDALLQPRAAPSPDYFSNTTISPVGSGK